MGENDEALRVGEKDEALIVGEEDETLKVGEKDEALKVGEKYEALSVNEMKELPAMSDQVATGSRVESPNLARPFEVRIEGVFKLPPSRTMGVVPTEGANVLTRLKSVRQHR
ncbi:hypothetical protein DEO72_LG8g1464 [Vigna unguiculata]|uniref:Uncharacterized protein n=1 Tax=Vigna unguiculata TaxID=3917 RepID=A0A4D6MPH7_VIGUN|nr:hypothetical protein DEO72_LG8g1464 [Vigna unguiculata]